MAKFQVLVESPMRKHTKTPRSGINVPYLIALTMRPCGPLFAGCLVLGYIMVYHGKPPFMVILVGMMKNMINAKAYFQSPYLVQGM